MNEELNVTDPNIGLHIGVSFNHSDERGPCVRVRVVLSEAIEEQPGKVEREVSTLIPVTNAMEASRWFIARVENGAAFQQGVESIRPEVERLTGELAEVKEKLHYANTLLAASVAVMEAEKAQKS